MTKTSYLITNLWIVITNWLLVLLINYKLLKNIYIYINIKYAYKNTILYIVKNWYVYSQYKRVYITNEKTIFFFFINFFDEDS